MLPYILGGAAALALLGGTKLRRKKRHHGDPRTAATQRIRIVDSRHAKTLRMARANPRVAKTHIEYVIQGNYGYGWDDENTELTWPDAKRSIREYRENGGGSYRMIKRRVKNDATNPKKRRKGKKAKWSSPGTAASRLAWWRWHHNPGSAPKGYKSATGRRLGRMLHFGEPPISSLKVAKVVARQNGDHVAYGIIRSALVAASANRSARQAVTIARKAARLLGYRGKWRS